MSGDSPWLSTLAVTRRPATTTSWTPGRCSRPAGTMSTSATTDVRVRCRSWAIVPDSTTTPCRMMLTRSHRASTSDRMWLLSSTVRPSARNASMWSRNVASISGSSPAVGSSSSSSSTSLASAATRATFCRLPLE